MPNYNPFTPYAGQQFGQPMNQFQPRPYDYSGNLGNMNQSTPQFQPPPQPSPIGLKGRTVGSVDEVRAAQIDLDGSKTYFPCPATGQVFVKYIGMDGNAVIEIYSKAEPVPPKQYAELSALQSLERRLNDLETALGGRKEA